MQYKKAKRRLGEDEVEFDLREWLKKYKITRNVFMERMGIDNDMMKKWCFDSGYIPYNSLLRLIKWQNELDSEINKKKKIVEEKPKSIFDGTTEQQYSKIFKQEQRKPVVYVYEQAVVDDMCPNCDFPMEEVDIEKTIVNIYGYNKKKFLRCLYCSSCKKYYVVYKRHKDVRHKEYNNDL